MGKSEVRVIRVRKPVTVLLLVIVSSMMAALLFYLSGKTYVTGSEPFRELLLRAMQRQRTLSRPAIVAGVLPAIANIFFFVPWGFLMFLAVDSPVRHRARTYAITIIAGSLFALAMTVWQSFLPTRVTGLPDTLAHALGAFGGAMLGHLRKRMHVQFDY